MMMDAMEMYFAIRQWAIDNGWRVTPDLKFYREGEEIIFLTIPEMYRLMTGEEKSDDE